MYFSPYKSFLQPETNLSTATQILKKRVETGEAPTYHILNPVLTLEICDCPAFFNFGNSNPDTGI